MSAARAHHPARPVVAGLAVLVLLAGCGHGAKVPAAAGTTSDGSTSTTVVPQPAVFPLTGLSVGTGTAAAARPALSIKVENTPSARPQAGLNAADVVTEELVEGGITRFFATFQSHNSPLVGPVRSARPVDAALLRQLGGGLFGYAGAAQGEIAPVKAYSNAVPLSPEQAPGAYSRSASRAAPTTCTRRPAGSTRPPTGSVPTADHPPPCSPSRSGRRPVPTRFGPWPCRSRRSAITWRAGAGTRRRASGTGTRAEGEPRWPVGPA